MKHNVLLNGDEAVIVETAVKNEMARKWLSQIFMAQHGYGKNFWAEEIDILADALMKLRDSRTE